MSEFSPHRVPSGVPAGGQFAVSVRAEADDIALNDGPTGEQRAQMIADALGPGEPLNAEQERLLHILTDPQVNEDCGYDHDLEAVLDEFDAYDVGYETAQGVAERLGAHYARHEGPASAGGFSFDLDHSYDGPSGYNVGVYLGHDHGVWLTVGGDVKYLSPNRHFLPEPGQEVSGLRKAIEVAGVIDGDFQRVTSKARSLGLLPKDAPSDDSAEGPTGRRSPSPWPETDEERVAYVDYQYEVANGDTPASFRDWYEDRANDENEDDE